MCIALVMADPVLAIFIIELCKSNNLTLIKYYIKYASKVYIILRLIVFSFAIF